MTKPRLATVWLDGCSGCHMSLLDMDERLLEIGERADLVYSPLVDAKEFPAAVDVTLVEGAVSSEDDLRRIIEIRERTTDPRVAGGLRRDVERPGHAQPDRRGAAAAACVRRERDAQPGDPRLGGASPAAPVAPGARRRHVDVFLPGCPPSADLIYFVLDELLSGRIPDTAGITHFGA